ncbi:MAG: flavodoxin family protein [Thermoplasmatales archaeon]|nr:flavodoxin family protein [Thermoplasmatales archaeon]
MKVVAFNCSPRWDGNTSKMIGTVLAELEKEGIGTQYIQVGGEPIRSCKVCGACKKNRDMKCVLEGDKVNSYIQRMAEADGIIIGSPTYFGDVSSEAKALMDRCGYAGRGGVENPFRRKIGAAVVAARRAGAMHAIDTINHFFTINEMFVVGSTYWNLSLAKDKGDFEEDEEGVATMVNLGKNMAWGLKRFGGIYE